MVSFSPGCQLVAGFFYYFKLKYMTQENFNKACMINNKIWKLQDLLKMLNNKNAMISLTGAGILNTNFNEMNEKLNNTINLIEYQNEILEHLKMSCELSLEKLNNEFKNL